MTTTLVNALNAFKEFIKGLNLPNPFAALKGALDAVNSGIGALQDLIGEYLGNS